jgi:hypothetical protein
MSIRRFTVKFVAQKTNIGWDLMMDIPAMLTPRTGHIDPPQDWGFKELELLTILPFFS